MYSQNDPTGPQYQYLDEEQTEMKETAFRSFLGLLCEPNIRPSISTHQLSILFNGTRMPHLEGLAARKASRKKSVLNLASVPTCPQRPSGVSGLVLLSEPLCSSMQQRLIAFQSTSASVGVDCSFENVIQFCLYYQ